jgi:hypothetical protein
VGIARQHNAPRALAALCSALRAVAAQNLGGIAAIDGVARLSFSAYKSKANIELKRGVVNRAEKRASGGANQSDVTAAAKNRKSRQAARKRVSPRDGSAHSR